MKCLILLGVSNSGKTTMLKKLAEGLFPNVNVTTPEVYHIGRVSNLNNKVVYIGTDGDTVEIIKNNILRACSQTFPSNSSAVSRTEDVASGVTSTTVADIIVMPVTLSNTRCVRYMRDLVWEVKNILDSSLSIDEIRIVSMPYLSSYPDLTATPAYGSFARTYAELLTALNELA